jgi:hypothetical protein
VTGRGNRVLEAEILFERARVARDRGDLHQAITHAAACIGLTETLRTATTNPELRGSFQAAEEDKYAFYIDLLVRLHEREPDAGHDAAALQVSEQARARLLLEALIEARADVRRGVGHELLARERAQQLRLHEAAERLSDALGSGDSAEVERARRALEAAEEEYGRIEARIRLENPLRGADPRRPAWARSARSGARRSSPVLRRRATQPLGLTPSGSGRSPRRRTIEARARASELMTPGRLRAGRRRKRTVCSGQSLAQPDPARRVAPRLRPSGRANVCWSSLGRPRLPPLRRPALTGGRRARCSGPRWSSPRPHRCCSRAAAPGETNRASGGVDLADPVFEATDPRVRSRAAGAARPPSRPA